MDKILEDIRARGARVAAFIVSDDKTGALRLVTYDDNGCVDFLSDQFPEVGLYGFRDPDSRAMTPIGNIRSK